MDDKLICFSAVQSFKKKYNNNINIEVEKSGIINKIKNTKT